MIVSFLMFFSFALNTGLLINAKISVQTAADAAAYAGAATQARQLNAISYLNYDMRRQFKKFLFRYVYVGSFAGPRFPQTSSGATSGQYDFPKLDHSTSAAGTMLGIKAPVVCIPITSSGSPNDSCTQINVRNTAFDVQSSIGSALGSLNAITQAYVDGVIGIGNVQNRICNGQGSVNLFVLMAWLFRANVDNTDLTNFLEKVLTQNNLAAAEKAQILTNVGPLVKGLGLYPRNILNLMRINTLKTFINEKPTTVTQDEVLSLEKSTGADAHERTILAFKSALANLNASIFDADKLSMQELQPENMIALEDVHTTFNVYVQAMEAQAPGATLNPNDPVLCNSKIYAFEAKQAPVGVKRIPIAGKNVTYAVKLRAFVKPRGLLFAPGSGSLELDAIAGAKPFGSRIGPASNGPADWIKTISGIPSINGASVCASPPCNSPFISIGANSDFFSIDFLTELNARAKNGGSMPTVQGIVNAQRHAMAPNPEEVGLYNILPPPPEKESEMDFQFIPYSDSVSKGDAAKGNPQIYRFYAPLYPDSANDTSQKVKTALDAVFGALNPLQNNSYGMSLPTIRDKVNDNLNAYISGPMRSGNQVENAETETFAAIELPMADLEKSKSKPFWLTESNQVLSSWSPEHNKISGYEVKFTPRFSYSVKLVAIRDLLHQGVSSEDADMETLSH